MRIKIKKLDQDAIVPRYATNGSACFDLVAVINELRPVENGRMIIDTINIPEGQAMTFRTGLAFEVPSDHVMLIFSRSGHGFMSDTRLANCVGVIDSDYRGEVKVRLSNDQRNKKFTVGNGDRIAQAMVIPIQQVEFEEVEELSSTERGNNGFGSTGN